MSAGKKPEIPRAQIYYGGIVYWITVVSCMVCTVGPVIALASPEDNVLDPFRVYDAIFEGKTAETVWEEAGEGFPGGHFYLDHLLSGDGLTQLGLALGCSVALWGLVAAAVSYARERKWLFMLLGSWVALLVFLSMTGIVSSH